MKLGWLAGMGLLAAPVSFAQQADRRDQGRHREERAWDERRHREKQHRGDRQGGEERAGDKKQPGEDPVDRAWNLYREGKLAEAERAYRDLTQRHPASVAVHYEFGLVLRDLNKLDEAEKMLSRATTLDPAFAAAHSALGSVYIERKWFDKAADALQVAVRLDEKDAVARFRLGYVHLQRKEPKKARNELERAVKLDPEYAFAWYTLGQALVSLEEKEKAIGAFWRSLEIDPDDPGALRSVREQVEKFGTESDKQVLAAFMDLTDGNKKEAAEKLLPLAGKTPANARVWALLGQATDDPEALRKALKLDDKAPKNERFPRKTLARLLEALSDVLLSKGEFADATRVASEGIKADPKRARLHFLLACALARQGKIKAACKALERALQSGDQKDVTLWARSSEHLEPLHGQQDYESLVGIKPADPKAPPEPQIPGVP